MRCDGSAGAHWCSAQFGDGSSRQRLREPANWSLTATSALVISAALVGGLAIIGRRKRQSASLVTSIAFAVFGAIPAVAARATLPPSEVRVLMVAGLTFTVFAVAGARFDPRWVPTAAVAQGIVAGQTLVWLRQVGSSATIVPVQFVIVGALAVISTIATQRHRRLATL